ncbi:uncharacterized protein BKA55DRAFT_543392 [Fusarium redolens]|uniref:NmrA-like domain-containing protein n=1 Tax=Fusarium redolens TaxID=48865 RepID=A0A9P9JXX3_FUSRE|nr:uncharacterized protein BKA55DRAFT_543392 [Fusarium redolens]KAH7236745.1 hypothetical protein BKA55DRAFT_543392 [Fusarium redolens]
MSTYLVTQATGQQSQWVIKHLLKAGHKIHAVVRNIEKVPTLLNDSNITLFQGESKNFDDVFNAARGCEAAFLNTVSFPGLELLQAKTIVEACEKAGVKNLVAATVICADRKDIWENEGVKAVPHLHGYYTSKYEVESIVRAGKFESYTILRPALIHYDFFIPGVYNNFPRLPTEGEIDDLFTGGAKFPYTDAHDVGKYAAAALQDHTRFRNQEIDLGNELLDFEQVRDILVKVSGGDVGVVKRTFEEVEKLGISVHGHMFQYFANMKPFGFIEGQAKQIQDKFGIPFTSLEGALRRDKVRLMECIPAKKEVQ